VAAGEALKGDAHRQGGRAPRVIVTPSVDPVWIRDDLRARGLEERWEDDHFSEHPRILMPCESPTTVAISNRMPFGSRTHRRGT
jgi:hypothetical protein